MTQKTKMEIIGPYTPEHPGPFCTRDGRPVEILSQSGRGPYPVVGYIGYDEGTYTWTLEGTHYKGKILKQDLMNAREVPVAREFWDVVEKVSGSIHSRFNNSDDAMDFWRKCADQTEVIHVREILPGEGA